MLLGPRRVNRSLLDVMTDPFDMFMDLSASMPKPSSVLMKTDIKETDKAYEMTIDLPGCNKDDIDVEIKDGYLTVSASMKSESSESDKDGTFIRKERFSGKSSRNFYVGDEIQEDDIKAKFDNGILNITVPKKEIEPKSDEKKVISVEGN